MGTQATDKIETTNVGIQFTVPDETWTINAGVLVSSHDNDGVASDQNGSTLINNGNIISGNYFGVDFTGLNATIVNNAGHNIASLYGIRSFSGGATITNHGTLEGYQYYGILFDSGSENVVLNNDGTIYGRQAGVVMSQAGIPHTAGGLINNAGLITSDHLGVSFSLDASLTLVIDNAAGGIIKGPDGAIVSGSSGELSLTNRGTIIGQVDCTAAHFGSVNDVVINHGKIQGEVHLGLGNDTFSGTGGSSGAIFGDDGNDHLTGGKLNDKIHGGAGNDTLAGGPGKDQFIFDTALNAATNVDKITDFTPAQHDKIVLSETYFAHLGPLGTLSAVHFHVNHAGPSGSPQIVYTQGNGFLYYDSNGNAPGGTTHFATLSTHPLIHATDFIVEA